jgi:redox-sensing transcriptional repressor
MNRKPEGRALKHALLERLMHYYYFVGERVAKNDEPPGRHGHTVSSAEIAKFLNMDDTLVRKDLASVGVRGYPRVGFRATEVLAAIRELLGFNRTYRAIIVGAGRMGGALASSTDFSQLGLQVVAVFDNDIEKHGMVLGGIEVQPMVYLEAVVQQMDVRLAILTVPAEPAQGITDRLVRAGVQAIWSFAPTALVTPESVVVRHEHIAVGLAEVAYHLKEMHPAAQPETPPLREDSLDGTTIPGETSPS